ncbi:hypothetical protein K503DRAFT_808564 [Rhizopogon vinicolor AM-OR11-026]|uniref:Protein kinase domain-containing protein n=1 Tax=Rhizopogon vinicolor AM-OR11-026 TaxID=1314800 RepID=A0A1B7MHM0_9AGAM|nr:hypothetical protein K503DRAFT_808564 [Rhizopogon vinicolor AM-OR11-026]
MAVLLPCVFSDFSVQPWSHGIISQTLVTFYIMPTNPEYLCVEPHEPDAPATAAAAPIPNSEPRLAAGSQNVSNSLDKCKADETLQFSGKRAKTDDDTEHKLDVTVQTGLYTDEIHYALRKAGLYHRDVSPSNMMWYRNGRILMGVLNDYDLSSLADAQGPQGNLNECTGTIPFMALDLFTEEGQ